MKPAVFLDRDGVVIEHVHHLHRPDDVRLERGSGEAIRALNEAGVLAIVVTNQSVVARGICTEAELEDIHRRLRDELTRQGAKLDGLYTCPHFPPAEAADRPGFVADYLVDCACRKPATGMLDRAFAEHGIDRSRAWVVGDSSSDIELGHRAGLPTILVATGYGGRDGKFETEPTHRVPNLHAAVQMVLGGQLPI